MRLNFLKKWLNDEQGLVLVFSALVLPIILLIGVMVLQSGQLYVRQAQLQFLARQSANSSLVVMAERLQNAAEDNYESTCDTEFPPDICSSSNWTDFLNSNEARLLASSTANVLAVRQEVQNFAVRADPQQKVTETEVSVIFPFEGDDPSELIAQVLITEPQTSWIGNVLKPEIYALTVEARSHLNLNES